MEDLLFWILAVLLAASAVGVVMARNLWRAAYCLAGALVVTAVFYLLLTSPLLSAVQILLYTGGVLTLVVYALVVTAQTDDAKRWRRPLPALIVSLLVFLVLAGFVTDVGPLEPAGGLEDGRAAGSDLFTRYIVPFELLSVLLLGAIFGALVIARKEGTP
jgi:NADH:ubiquinone oxidoreductase subunit 6 (subunit J)